MPYDIGPKIGIDGEAEFRRELQDINQGLKTLGSEMAVVTSAFIGNENSVEALTAKNDVLDRTILSLNEKLVAQQRMLKESAQAYGEADARTQKWQQAVNRTTAELNKTEAQIRQNNEAMASSDSLIGQITNTLTGKLGSALGLSADQTKQLTSAVGQVSTSLTGKLENALGLSSGSMQSLTSALGAGGEGMTAMLSSSTALVGGIAAIGVAAIKAAGELVKMSEAAAKQADEILTLSTNYGIAASDLQKLDYMAELTDVSVETVTGSLSKLVRSMDSARGGAGDAAEAFAALGVRVTESDGTLRNSNEVFMETIDALGRVQNGTERDAAAMAIFGRSAQDLNGIIAIGSEGLSEYAQEAENSGYVMSDKMLTVLSDADDATQRLDKAQEGLQNTLGALVAPAVTSVKDALADMTAGVSNAIQEVFNLKDAGDQLAATAQSVNSSIRDLTAADFQTPQQQYAAWVARNQELQRSGPQTTTTIIVKNPPTTDNQLVRSLTPQVEAYTSLRGGTL